MALTEVDRKVLAAIDAGYFECEVCNEPFDLEAQTYDAARKEIVNHAEENHD